MRVLRITGLPSITAGLVSIRSVMAKFTDLILAVSLCARRKRFSGQRCASFLMMRENARALLFQAFQDDGGGVVVAGEAEGEAVVHEPGSAEFGGGEFEFVRVEGMEAVDGFFVEAGEAERGDGVAEVLGVEEAEDDGLFSVFGDVLIGGEVSGAGGGEAVEVSGLDGGADGFVPGDHAFGEIEVFGGHFVEVVADAEGALHGGEEAEGERGGAVVEVGDVGDPGHHDSGRVGVGEAFLDAEAVEGVGVVGGPDLVGAAEDAEVDASAAAGAGFDFEVGVFAA